MRPMACSRYASHKGDFCRPLPAAAPHVTPSESVWPDQWALDVVPSSKRINGKARCLPIFLLKVPHFNLSSMEPNASRM